MHFPSHPRPSRSNKPPANTPPTTTAQSLPLTPSFHYPCSVPSTPVPTFPANSPPPQTPSPQTPPSKPTPHQVEVEGFSNKTPTDDFLVGVGPPSRYALHLPSRSDLEKTTMLQNATVLCLISSLIITLTSKSKPVMRQTALWAPRCAAWR